MQSLNDHEMPLMDHLGELRVRLVRAALSLLGVFCVSVYFSSEILQFLKGPLISALPVGTSSVLHFTGPLEVFMAGLKVAFLSSVVGSSPFWLYQFWKFVEPALYIHERKLLFPAIVVSCSLFWVGLLFCYYVILPLGLKHLILVGLEVGTPMITVNDYISILGVMLFGFGFVFEAPMILVLLAFLGVIDAQMLSEQRKLACVLSLVLGAVLTTPDPVTQIAMAIPLYLMYELSIVIIRWIRPVKKEALT